ncbi:Beta-ketoacyl synthase [Catenulispora acidiphila DSM 44928]|uniref:Beta-ketoacyl synthase n=1 Tax=Catenulispora acidiphila (strain DSM 44928 / JCM 14897 / NBRC 102108 / NRRL B-24433 / ID139908) TaxID=479433 RepID=C7Q555_CATAD|nr:SDR family NAD(P)-dependent oxidoreductase [Catenulispora acidiphila]ACU75824.1 Beta-ketoacyl synthase [Catenulispora acidiphila DSM 44928]
MTDPDYDGAIALIGMSGRFPGAESVAGLWRDLLAGVPGLRAITDEELAAAGVGADRLADPEYIRVGGPLVQVDRFDAGVFGFSPREAETMEPQHRMFLECSWEALESAGYCPTDTPGHVGVFGGSGFPHYMMSNVRHVAEEPGGDLLLGVGNERDSLANLVSYKLGLRGPAIAVQSFCSTSLVSVHLAVQSLLTFECDIALAGGAYIPLPQPVGYQFEHGGILSPNGRVRSFDAGADGTVMGSGVGVVALKRMTEALADGDVIHAVLLGSSVNNDGRVRVGYTAPGVDGQAEVIATALEVAGVKPETVGYVECHATGTGLGDSIELAAMERVFRQTPEKPCVLGSLKPSIGHLDRASGVAGLMRAALCLENRILPATPNYTAPNTAMAGAGDRFRVLTENEAWERGSEPRRAGVSSFGLGGTNAHVVLEEAPEREARAARTGPQLLTFSAADAGALSAMTERLRAFLVEDDAADLADVAFTSQVSRGGFALRRAVVCADRDDAIAALADPARWIDGEARRRAPRVRLVEPGADAVSDEWWAQLGAAVAALVPEVGEAVSASASRSQDSVMAMLGDALQVLGVRSGEDGVEVVVAPDGTADATSWLLATVARLWESGAAIEWPVLHGGAGRRVELPTYPFQRRRYWVEARPEAAPSEPVGRAADPSQWTYLPVWDPFPLPTADLDERLRLAGPWLVLSDDERTETLIARLGEAGAEVVAVRPGAAFDQDDVGDFVIPRLDDFAELFESMLVAPRTIVHGFSLGGVVFDADADAYADPDPVISFSAAQERGYHSALALARYLVDDTGEATPLDLVLLTSGATTVAGADLRHPEHATLAAIAATLSQENPRLRAREIDIDAVAAGGRKSSVTAERFRAEAVLAAATAEYEGPVAERAGQTWLRRYLRHPLPRTDAAFKNGDRVLITGGLGDVGLTLSRHLATGYGCRLILCTRSTLPPRSAWQDFLADVPAGQERTARHVQNILALEASGAEVIAMTADVADPVAMQAVVDAAVARFGGIDVAVHGAGVQDSRFFAFAHLTEREQSEAHLDAKIRGFLVLDQVLAGHCPERRITLSSLSAVLGGLTLGAYAASNAGLDAYARAARAAGSGRWVTVDWDTWNIDAERLDGHGPTVTDFTMAPAEGVDVFERALAASDRVGHVVISTGPLNARLAQWVTGGGADGGDGQDDDVRERYARPDLPTPFEEPRPGTEAALAEIWSAALGVEPVGALDDFFALGGHSLVAIKVTTRIRKTLNASVPATALLEAPTVRGLAALIDG